MSQVSIIDIEGNHPQIPTQFDTDSGSAIPIGNVLEILATYVAAGSIPARTTGSGNTVTVEIQTTQEIAASDVTKIGLAAFDSVAFDVDANGFVTFAGGGAATSIDVDAFTAPGTDPVAPTGGNIIMKGAQVASGTIGTNVIRTNSLAASTVTIEIQRSAATAGSASNANGVSHFNSTEFTVDSSGYVSLVGGTAAIDSLGVQSTSGTGTNPVLPTVGGQIEFEGGTVVAGTTPMQAVSTAVNTVQIQAQISQALAAADATKIGLAAFGSEEFQVDAAGFTQFSTNAHSTAISSWNGAILETTDVNVSSDGATVTLSIEKTGGGDLTVAFSDGFYTWDTTPAATVSLTAGSDTSPTLNYVYFLQSTKTLTVSTASWPATEYAPIASILCQSAGSIVTEEPYKIHLWTDHTTSTNDQGHIAHLNYWIRQQSATWIDGVSQTYSISGGPPNNVLFTTSSGNILQLHTHDFPAFSGTPDIYVVNNFAAPFTVVTDLNQIIADSTGATLVGRYYSLVIWGCVSEDASTCKLYLNLPSGSYGNSTGVLDDIDAYSNYTIPSEFRGTGFLISEWKLRQQATGGGTFTSIDEIDLRGLFPSLSAGGSPSSGSEFIDNVFRILNVSDNTKEIAFDASAITTATTRTITMADYDIDMAELAKSFPATSGTAVPALGVLTTAGAVTAAGTVPVSTLGAASTLTVQVQTAQALAATDATKIGLANFDSASFAVDANGFVTFTSPSGGFAWSDTSGAFSPLKQNGYFITGTATGTLPASPTQGDTIKFFVDHASQLLTIQAAGTQLIRLGSSVSSAGGTVVSTAQGDSVELVYRSSDDQWCAIAGFSGNWTLA